MRHSRRGKAKRSRLPRAERERLAWNRRVERECDRRNGGVDAAPRVGGWVVVIGADGRLKGPVRLGDNMLRGVETPLEMVR